VWWAAALAIGCAGIGLLPPGETRAAPPDEPVAERQHSGRKGEHEPGLTIDKIDPEFWGLTQARMQDLPADAYRRRGRELLARVDPASAENAIQLLQKGTQLYPDDAGLLGDYAEALLTPYRWTWNREDKWRTLAARALDRARAIEPRRPEVLRADGLLLMLDAHLDEAEAGFRAALDVAPEDLEALLLLGGVLRLQDRFADAYRVLDRAVAVAPFDFRCYSALGDVYRDDQWFEEALNLYRKANELDQEAFLPRYGQAIVYQRYGHSVRALKMQQELMKEFPRFESLVLLSAAATHMEAKDWASALIELEQIKLGGTRGLCHGSVLYRIGLCKLRQGDDAGALAAFRRTIDEFPAARDGSDYGERVLFPAAIQLATLLDRAGKPQEAIDRLEQASQDADAPLGLQLDLAARLTSFRLHDRAADALRRGLEGERPTDRLDERLRLRVELVRVLTASGRRAALAEQAVPALRELEPRAEQEGSPADCIALARAHALLGEPEVAMRWLTRAVDMGYRQRDALRADPDLASLRDQPGFVALLRGK
jgi:tetratricopeptide (TPR) repeat protein